MKALVTAFLALSLSSYCATITPTEANLRAAIDTETEILFAASETIKLSTPIEINSDVTIDGAGATIEIDGQQTTTLFIVNAGGQLTLRNLTLANGRALGRAGDSANIDAGNATGGALQNRGGILNVEICVFRNNSAIGGQGYTSGSTKGAPGFAEGGAIYQKFGQLTVRNCAFTGNFARGGQSSLGGAPAGGGAIHATANSVEITGSEFLDNFVQAGSGPVTQFLSSQVAGGAVYIVNAPSTISDTIFRGNRCEAGLSHGAFGGAVHLSGGNSSFNDCLFTANLAIGGPGVGGLGSMRQVGGPARGGAIHVNPFTVINVSGTTFDGNYTRAGLNYVPNPAPNQTIGSGPSQGGAIYFVEAAFINNSTFHANTVLHTSTNDTVSGAAIEAAGQLTLTRTTLANNIGRGAVVNSATSANLKAVVFGANKSERNFNDIFTDDGFNLSADSTPAFTEASSANNTDSKLGPLGLYGGPTPTMPILHGSPAIDRVTDNLVPDLDQRGRARYGAHLDAGAFESSPPFHILGQLHGYVPAGTIISHTNATETADANGRFVLPNIPAGNVAITVTNRDAIFPPGTTNLNVQADMTFDARGHRAHAFTLDSTLAAPVYTFAARTAEQWDFYSSTNLKDWSPAGTHTFPTDNIHSIPLTGLNPPIFLKAARR